MAWIWYGAGGVCGAVGLGVLVWALLWDRARGRLRCPRCWYDMSGAGEGELLCPECGRDARRARRLRRTRRRWGWSVVGALVVLVGGGFAWVGRALEIGWARAAPTTALIVVVPWVTGKGHWAHDELLQRVNAEEWESRYAVVPDPRDLGLWWWQRRLLCARCEAAIDADRGPATREFGIRLMHGLGPEAAPAVDSIREMIAGEPALRQGGSSLRWRALRVLEGVGPTACQCVGELVALIEADGAARDIETATAVRILGGLGAAGAPAVPGLMRLATTHVEFGGVRNEAITALGKVGPAACEAVPMLVEVCLGTRMELRAPALEAIGRIDSEGEPGREVALDSLMSWEVHYRQAGAAIVAANEGLLREGIARLVRAAESDQGTVRFRAIQGMAELARFPAEVREAVLACARDEDPTVRMYVVDALRLMAPSCAPAGEALKMLAEDSDPVVSRRARQALTSLQGEDEP